jgi:hypothetical protein
MMSKLTWTRKRKLLGAAVICVVLIAGLTLWLNMGRVAEAAVLDPHPGLVGWWRFDEGTGSTAKDSSEYGNDGTVYGATWTDGKYNKALSLNGINNYVEIPHSSSLSMTDVTIEMWYYPQGRGHLADKRSWDGANKGWFIRQDGNGIITFEQWNGGGSAADALQATVFTYNVWHHIVCVFKSGTYIKIYHNGVETASKNTAITGVCNGDSKLRLGCGDWAYP